VLIEVSIAGEAAKAGVAIEAALDLVRHTTGSGTSGSKAS